MQTTWRIPSKKVPYGYLEFTVAEGEALPDPEALANQYADYITRYQKAEVVAFEQGPKPQVATVTSIVTEDEAAELIKRELGGVELSEEEAAKPWNQEQAEDEKAWESDEVTASGSDWDFG